MAVLNIFLKYQATYITPSSDFVNDFVMLKLSFLCTCDSSVSLKSCIVIDLDIPFKHAH